MVVTILVQFVLSPAAIARSVEDEVFSDSTEAEESFTEETQPGLSDNNVQVRDTQDDLNRRTTVVPGQRIPYKDPRLACILSVVIPGGGEFYLRNDMKGITFCLTTTTAYLLSFYFLYQALGGGGGEARSNLIAGSIGFIAATILHIVGMVESYNDAVQINEARYYYAE